MAPRQREHPHRRAVLAHLLREQAERRRALERAAERGLEPGVVSRLTADERNLYQDSEVIRDLLHRMQTVAIVGLSDKKERASNFVASYLKSEGYKIIPVNPTIKEVFGDGR